jgi:hypothetical protein
VVGLVFACFALSVVLTVDFFREFILTFILVFVVASVALRCGPFPPFSLLCFPVR